MKTRSEPALHGNNYRMTETTKGRVVFAAGRDLDRFVVWDYIKMRKSIVA